MKALLEYKGKVFYDEDLKACFRKLGVARGDTLCVHTELFGFGTPLLARNDYLSALIECFWQAIGEEGTLLMPTFSYSFCKNESYDKNFTRSTVGILTKFFRKQNGVFRTNDPIFSFAVAGKKQKAFMKGYDSCFGKGCVYDTLVKERGKIMLFGTIDLGYTFTHFVEEEVKVSYRYFKEFKGEMIDEQGIKQDKTIHYFVRALDKPSVLSVKKQRALLERTYNFQCTHFAGAPIALIEAKKYLDEFVRVFKDDENALLL